jgi:hypothetical protein
MESLIKIERAIIPIPTAMPIGPQRKAAAIPKAFANVKAIFARDNIFEKLFVRTCVTVEKAGRWPFKAASTMDEVKGATGVVLLPTGFGHITTRFYNAINEMSMEISCR